MDTTGLFGVHTALYAEADKMDSLGLWYAPCMARTCTNQTRCVFTRVTTMGIQIATREGMGSGGNGRIVQSSLKGTGGGEVED